MTRFGGCRCQAASANFNANQTVRRDSTRAACSDQQHNRELSSMCRNSDADELSVRWRGTRLSFIETLFRADHVRVARVEGQRVAT